MKYQKRIELNGYFCKYNNSSVVYLKNENFWTVVAIVLPVRFIDLSFVDNIYIISTLVHLVEHHFLQSCFSRVSYNMSNEDVSTHDGPMVIYAVNEGANLLPLQSTDSNKMSPCVT